MPTNEAPVDHEWGPSLADLQPLSWTECRELLAGARVGRVAVTREGRPTIAVVPFNLRHDHVWFTTGTALAPFVRDAVVAFEVDHLGRDEAWSVVVTGVAAEVPAHGRGGGRAFRLPLRIMSGRLLNRAPMYVPAERYAEPGPARPAGDRPPGPDSEWLDLLASQEVGRLAVVAGGQPEIFPVNYVVDGGSIVFRTDPGTKLTASRRRPVAFETGPPSSTWSVVVEGIGHEITSVAPGSRAGLAALELWPWAGGDRLHYVRILPASITGSRFPGWADPPAP